MIKLYGFGKNLGLIDPSPFVAKVHTFLKVANLEYEVINSPSNISKSPKGKLPFIEDDNKVIGDSQDIMNYLADKYQIDLDAHLDTKQKATSYLMTKSLDENLYWCLVWSRWQHQETWQIVKPVFFGGIPFPLSFIIPKILRKKLIKAIYAQGMGRHSDKEIIAIAGKSFSALSDFLGDNNYFFGDKISRFDVTAFAFIAAFTHAEIDNDINNEARSFPNLVNYVDNMKREFNL